MELKNKNTNSCDASDIISYSSNFIERTEILNFLNENLKNFDKKNDDYKKNIYKNFVSLFIKYFDKIFYLSTYEKKEKNKFLFEIIEYSIIGNGKRLRPMIMFLTNFLFDEDFDNTIFYLEYFMLSIEMIHAFSLIHDDLPAIDNDELRRGKESTWKKFGESFAILAGDMMLSEAYNNINILKYKISKLEYNKKNEFKKIDEAAFLLSDKTGYNGMILGELLDVKYTNKKINSEELVDMYEKKTAALIKISFEIGFVLSNCENIKNKELIEKISKSIGFTYQLIDDLLEIESDEKRIGKSINSDSKNKKDTLANKYGINETKKIICEYKNSINTDICDLEKVSEEKKSFYKYFMNFIVDRDR